MTRILIVDDNVDRRTAISIATLGLGYDREDHTPHQVERLGERVNEYDAIVAEGGTKIPQLPQYRGIVVAYERNGMKWTFWRGDGSRVVNDFRPGRPRVTFTRKYLDFAIHKALGEPA